MWRVGADPDPQKSRSSSPIPQSVLHGLSLSLSLSTHLSTHLSTYISSLRSSLLSGNNWDGNYKFGIFGSCEIIFARLDFDFATASKMITFLRFLLPAYLFSAILQHQLHGKQIDGKDGNTCLLPHASQLRGERSSLQLLLLSIFSSSSTAGTLQSPTCHMCCKVPLLLLLLCIYAANDRRSVRA